jgi:hypothetical protein
MKKLLVILGLVVSSQAFAVSALDDFALIEYEHFGAADQTSPNQNAFSLMARKNLNSWLAADVQMSQINNEKPTVDTLASARIESGLFAQVKTIADFNVFSRVAVGQKYNSTTNFGYYSVEPGLGHAIPGVPGLSSTVSYRYRSAFDEGKGDTTHTVRAALWYDLNRNNNVYVRYDNVRGDVNQNGYTVGYIHSF